MKNFSRVGQLGLASWECRVTRIKRGTWKKGECRRLGNCQTNGCFMEAIMHGKVKSHLSQGWQFLLDGIRLWRSSEGQRAQPGLLKLEELSSSPSM